MFLTESIVIGFREIFAHKLRSLLTALGVVFGVAAVIATVAIGAGAEQETLKQISLLGTNNIRIRKANPEGVEKARAAKIAPFGLTMADLGAIQDISGKAIVDYGVARRFIKTISHAAESPPAAVIGVTPGYAESISFKVDQGRFINNFDMMEQKKVCVIGRDIQETLFPLDPPLEGVMQIGGRDFEIVGVMERKSVSSAGGILDVGNLNQYVMIPFTTGMGVFEADLRQEKLDEIVLKLKIEENVGEIAHLVGEVLSKRHGGVSDHEIVIPEELLKQRQKVQRIFRYTLIAIAGISLLVGGIGIMNIMLSTVTQRTREIGVRRAIGATQRDILSQFIIESLALSIVGGVIGVAMGVGLAKFISYYTHWSTPISVPAIVVSFSVSALTGLVFGLYPAMKAAQLDPIEALRYE